ncbi:MAG: AraC family transcriptional regulator [Acidobacteriota bacterium]
MERGYAPVPVREHELLQELQVGSGLRVTEARHRPSSRIERHAHRRATLTILIEGSFDESYSWRRDMACEAPTVHVRPPGEPHRDRFGTRGAHNLVLEIGTARLESVRRYSCLFDEVRHVQSAETHSVARRLRRELLIDDDASDLAIEGLSMEMLATASRSHQRDARRPAPWLVRVHDLLHDRFREPRLALDELATVAGVHPVHLARSFRAAYRASPGEYLRQLRVDWAADALTTTERPLAEIASEAGFADQSHFTRVFRAAYGMPPGAWRRAHKS